MDVPSVTTPHVVQHTRKLKIEKLDSSTTFWVATLTESRDDSPSVTTPYVIRQHLKSWKRFAWWFVVSLWWWLGKTTVWVRGLTLDRLRFALRRLTRQKKQTKIQTIILAPKFSLYLWHLKTAYWMLIKKIRTEAALTLAGCHCYVSLCWKTSIHQGRRIDAEFATPYWWLGHDISPLLWNQTLPLPLDFTHRFTSPF